jgi:hypothetical protein
MVRPVELQDNLAKTPAVERITHLQKSDPENEQRQVIQSTGQKAQDAQRKPVPATHTDEVVLHRDREREAKKRKDKREKDAGDREAEKETKSEDDTDDTQNPPPALDITV